MLLYNTLSRKKENLPSFKDQKEIKLYTCGPTVYDYTHIGHMRKYTMDDILKRSLEYLGYDVKHVMNITDVGHLTGDDDSGEDKLEKGAKKHGKSVWDVAKEYEDHFWKTMDALNVIRPDKVMHATKHIDDMIALNKKLENKGFTYETDEALYFDVTKFENYGKLSGQKLEEKLQGAREDVHIDPQKKHPADFALWFKRVGRFKDHNMHWDSPWGDGFPGWHLECSAMSMVGLHSQTIDIHTGGIDHIPVHHENEIAQSEAATGEQFVKYWVHHAFLQVDGEKMSKSKGNFYTLEDMQKNGVNPLAIRYLFLQTHYRKSLNFTWDALHSAEIAYKSLLDHVIEIRSFLTQAEQGQAHVISDEQSPHLMQQFIEDFRSAIENDLNTPQALALVWEVLKSNLNQKQKLDLIYNFDTIFGFDIRNYTPEEIPDDIYQLAEQRKQAREQKDFNNSDKLRKQIEEKGYLIEDTSSGYTLKKK